MAPKKPAGKKTAPKSPTAGERILAAIRESSTPEAVEAVITGNVPPGAPFTISRVVPPAAVAALRAELGLSQAAFAAFLGASVQTVQAWEQGRNPVTGVAARFLEVIRGDLDLWKRRVSRPAG